MEEEDKEIFYTPSKIWIEQQKCQPPRLPEVAYDEAGKYPQRIVPGRMEIDNGDDESF